MLLIPKNLDYQSNSSATRSFRIPHNQNLNQPGKIPVRKIQVTGTCCWEVTVARNNNMYLQLPLRAQAKKRINAYISAGKICECCENKCCS